MIAWNRWKFTTLYKAPNYFESRQLLIRQKQYSNIFCMSTRVILLIQYLVIFQMFNQTHTNNNFTADIILIGNKESKLERRQFK